MKYEANCSISAVRWSAANCSREKKAVSLTSLTKFAGNITHHNFLRSCHHTRGHGFGSAENQYQTQLGSKWCLSDVCADLCTIMFIAKISNNNFYLSWLWIGGLTMICWCNSSLIHAPLHFASKRSLIPCPTSFSTPSGLRATDLVGDWKKHNSWKYL